MGIISRWLARPFVKNTFLLRKISLKNIPPITYLHSSRILSSPQEIRMPSLSPTMTEGTLIRWLKKEGDPISPGDVLCEIQTDKAVVGFEVEEEGILAKILISDDSKDIKIGTPIGIMVDSDEEWRNVAIPSNNTSQNIKHESSVQGIEIKMPSLSPTMTEGTIVKWLKNEGDSFCPGDAICEIQTDKAIVAFEVEEEGILAKILVPENSQNVQLGTVIAIMVMEGEDWKNVAIPSGRTKQSAEDPKSIPITQKVSSSVVINKHFPKLCGPSVRNLLHEYNIQYSSVTPTGPHKILLKGDVLKYIGRNNVKPKSYVAEELISVKPDILVDQNYTDILNTSMRHIIAKRLTESKTSIPHAYISIDCMIDEVLKLRKALKSENIAVSVNDFIIKCVADALVKVPEVNAINIGNDVKCLTDVDISIAVATDKGLITPIIKHANTLGVQQIAESVRHLAVKARDGRLKPDEYQGGSFSVSNLGMFGITEFSAVINPPQCAILAVGTSQLLYTGNESITKMTVTLSFDARAISYNDSAKFLQCFKENMEKPVLMAVNSPKKSHNTGINKTCI